MLQNFIATRALTPSAATKTATCAQCESNWLKYIEFAEFPGNPISFFIAPTNAPIGSTGIIEVHYWTDVPNENPPPTNRVWLTELEKGGSFLFEPTPERRFLSLSKSEGSFFDAICFAYDQETKTFTPKTFGIGGGGGGGE